MQNIIKQASIAVMFGALTASSAVAQRDEHRAAGTDSAQVVAAVHAFHAALESGDSAKALSLLTSDVVILESGSLETLAEYRAHHLPADINFAKSVPAKRTVMKVSVAGSSAWVASTSVSEGQSNGRTVNSAGAELVVLTQVGDTWKISAIHWSSRRRSSGG
jgi:ketosteroid isomerase-like protein